MLLLKRFFHFFHVRQQTQVSGKLAGGLGDASQSVEHQHVHLSRIGLAGHGHAAVEAHLRSDLPFQLLDLLMVALEQLQEGGLGAGGALAAQQLQVVDAVLHLVEIHQQFVHPKRGTLADRGQLGGLEMGEPQGGQRLVGVSEFGQIVQHPHQLIPHQEKSFPHDDHIGVVSHIATGSAQVDDGHGVRALVAVGMDVCHDIVAQLLFVAGGSFVVDVVHMLLHLGHLRLGHWQTQLHLRPSQGDPETVPGGELLIGGENILHLLAGIPGGQRAFVFIMIHMLSHSFHFMFQYHYYTTAVPQWKLSFYESFLNFPRKNSTHFTRKWVPH